MKSSSPSHKLRSDSPARSSLRAHLHVVGMLRFMSRSRSRFAWHQLRCRSTRPHGHKPPELAYSFLFCSCVCFCLHGPFNCISFHEFSRQHSACSLCSSGLICTLLILPTIYLFIKVSLSLIESFVVDWGLKDQLSKLPSRSHYTSHWAGRGL